MGPRSKHHNIAPKHHSLPKPKHYRKLTQTPRGFCPNTALLRARARALIMVFERSGCGVWDCGVWALRLLCLGGQAVVYGRPGCGVLDAQTVVFRPARLWCLDRNFFFCRWCHGVCEEAMRLVLRQAACAVPCMNSKPIYDICCYVMRWGGKNHSPIG